MLKLRNLRKQRPAANDAPGGSPVERPDLRIGNLLDDPRLRRALGLEEPAAWDAGCVDHAA